MPDPGVWSCRCNDAGVVSLWDATTGSVVSEFDAHEQRIWSLDFCKASPGVDARSRPKSPRGCTLRHSQLTVRSLVPLQTEQQYFVTGSDDGRVRVWSTRSPQAAFTVSTGLNVCCVNYSPNSSHTVAVGSVNHQIYIYDIRNVAAPLHTFQGHK